MGKVLRDPLFYFVVAGSVFYVLASLWGKPTDETMPERKVGIVISLPQQQHLADLFELTWQRQPNTDELNNLIAEHIKEEVYYREALRLGLDENDTIVRRRLRQKLEFVQADIAALSAPTESQLKKYFTAHQADFEQARLLSYQQVLVSKQRLEEPELQIASVKKKLMGGAKAKNVSLSSLLPVSMKLENENTVANTYGTDFLEQLAGLQKNQWAGPIYSSFGTHLVKLSLDQAKRPLEFAESVDKVRRDFLRSQREASAEAFYQDLRSQYQISVENSL